MKHKLLARMTAGLLMLGVGDIAHSAVIIDTGTNGVGITWSLYSDQWLAGEFSLSQNYTITDVEGYLLGAGGSTLTAAIYTDGGEIPGSELFSEQFSVNGLDDWYGASGLSWALATGTYWVSFEVRPGDTYAGSLPGSAINPLGNEAFTLGGNWFEFDSLSLGIRISGNTASVPEPASLALLALGLAGIGFSRRKNV